MDGRPLPEIVRMLIGSSTGADAISKSGFSFIDFVEGTGFLSETWKSLGVTTEMMIRDFPGTALEPSSLSGFEAMWTRLAVGGVDEARGQYGFRKGKDSIIWLILDVTVLERTEAGSPSLMVVHDEDVTAYVSTQEELRERLAEIDSLKDLLSSINKSLDFEETIIRIFEHLHRRIPFDRASVQILEGGILRVIGGYGYPRSIIRKLAFPVAGIDNPAARVIASRRPIICNDVENEFQGFVNIEGQLRVKSWLGIPLVYEDRAIGLFALDSFLDGVYDQRHIRIVSNIADHVSVAVQHAYQHTIVKEEARTDTLTGVANRYGLETEGQDIFQMAFRDFMPCGVLMIDIDYFKNMNDSYGHAYGDQILKAIAVCIAENLRPKDYLVRYGGEEFVVLLPETSTREALVVAERLREKIPQIEVISSRPCPTVSVGVFSGVPGPQDLLHEFIRRADLALYEAKEAGRNRCRVWSPKPEYFDKQRIPI